jgi:hypothetical protein
MGSRVSDFLACGGALGRQQGTGKMVCAVVSVRWWTKKRSGGAAAQADARQGAMQRCTARY